MCLGVNCFFLTVVVVGFSQSSYEMESGEEKEVCVLAEGDLVVMVTVIVSVNVLGTITRFSKIIYDSVYTRVIGGELDSKNSVELDKEFLVFNSTQDTACLLLNASYAIAQRRVIELVLMEELISGEQTVVVWSNQTAHVAITPGPQVSDAEQQSMFAPKVHLIKYVLHLSLSSCYPCDHHLSSNTFGSNICGVFCVCAATAAIICPLRLQNSCITCGEKDTILNFIIVTLFVSPPLSPEIYRA